MNAQVHGMYTYVHGLGKEQVDQGYHGATRTSLALETSQRESMAFLLRHGGHVRPLLSNTWQICAKWASNSDKCLRLSFKTHDGQQDVHGELTGTHHVLKLTMHAPPRRRS